MLYLDGRGVELQPGACGAITVGTRHAFRCDGHGLWLEMAAPRPRPDARDTFFELGMMYSTGRSVPPDLVAAHKWFNIAAMRGNAEATRLRREIASEMSEIEIAAAQRAARDWLSAH